MTPAFAAMIPLPGWHACLVALPAALALLLALFAGRFGNERAAWLTARGVMVASVAAALLSLGALAIGSPGAAWGVRADVAGGVVLLLVSFVGWVIVRYSQPYLDGERGTRDYLRWLMATLAAVNVVVATNHLLVLTLAWLATSLALHRLLTFFQDRPAALVAAHKKFIVSRAADVCMLGAVALLYGAFGTLQIDALLARAASLPNLPAGVQAAAALVALAALLKCAQLPFHGWLIQVMEAPTPVSALLHAGIVNLGGFVLMRLALLVAGAPAAQVLLVVAGTATAVIAALVMTTRISIKVSLAWSTCAQMGFMLLQCGLGIWEMALLHLVAHSLYKAHAFLGAGGVVRRTALRQMTPAVAAPGIGALLAGAAVGLAMTALAGLAWGIDPREQPALWVLGGIVALALTPLVQARALPLGGPWPVALVAGAFGVAFAWFALHALFAGSVATRSGASRILPGLVALAFLALFAIQCLLVAAPGGRLSRALYPWFYGGFFLDERFSQWAFRLWPVRLAHDAVRRPSNPSEPAGAVS